MGELVETKKKVRGSVLLLPTRLSDVEPNLLIWMPVLCHLAGVVWTIYFSMVAEVMGVATF